MHCALYPRFQVADKNDRSSLGVCEAVASGLIKLTYGVARAGTPGLTRTKHAAISTTHICLVRLDPAGIDCIRLCPSPRVWVQMCLPAHLMSNLRDCRSTILVMPRVSHTKAHKFLGISHRTCVAVVISSAPYALNCCQLLHFVSYRIVN